MQKSKFDNGWEGQRVKRKTPADKANGLLINQ